MMDVVYYSQRIQHQNAQIAQLLIYFQEYDLNY